MPDSGTETKMEKAVWIIVVMFGLALIAQCIVLRHVVKDACTYGLMRASHYDSLLVFERSPYCLFRIPR